MNILNAKIVNGAVIADGVTVKEAVLLCEAKSSSEGFLLIDKDAFFYLTKTTNDLTKALDLVVNAADLSAQILNFLSSDITEAVPSGGGPVKLPAFAADAQILQNKITQLKQQIENLKNTQV
ncbi:MAG: hypothetical protein LBC07_01505 [Elusimicrobiota bacterium]|jgi:hypothetical protein|nr:hypothetical protein [Elusimicrobiota bacterium]